MYWTVLLPLVLNLDTRQHELEGTLESVVGLSNSPLVECQRSMGADCRGLPHPSVFVSNANYSTSKMHKHRVVYNVSCIRTCTCALQFRAIVLVFSYQILLVWVLW